MAWSKTKISIVAAAAAVVVVAVTLFAVWFFNPERRAAAEGERLMDKNLAMPADLTSKIQTPASYFPEITQYPQWKAVPVGFQTFCHVPLQIDGMICLYGGGNAKKQQMFAESVTDIPLNQKFETLYVYHSSFYESPRGTPVYQIVFRYDDGSSATNSIVYGEDIWDWIVRKKMLAPAAKRSKIAWHGDSGMTNKYELVFYLTAVENPNPDLTVATIDLFSCKSKTAPCILAMTPGKSGLMQ